MLKTLKVTLWMWCSIALVALLGAWKKDDLSEPEIGPLARASVDTGRVKRERTDTLRSTQWADVYGDNSSHRWN